MSAIAGFAARRPLTAHACVYFVLVLVHLATAAQMRYPAVFYDEGAYLGYARYLAGAPHGFNMAGGAASAHPGYSILLAPAFLFGSAFYDQYHLALMINALLAGSIYLSLFFLLSRLTSLGRLPSAGIAIATCFYPSFLIFPNIAIADNAFIPVYLLVLVALYLLLETGTYWSAMLFGVSAGAAYLMHNRGGVVLATAAVFAILLAVYKHLAFRLSGLALALMAVFYVATNRATAAMGIANGAPPSPGGATMQWLLNSLSFGSVIHVSIGQIVYLCQATCCLYFAGWRMLWATAMECPRRTHAVVVGFITVTATSIYIGAALFISTQDPFSRPDHMLIGRYNEGTLAIVLAFSLALLYRAARDLRWRKLLVRWMGAGAAVMCLGAMFLSPSMRPLSVCSINAIGNMAFAGISQTAEIGAVSLLVIPFAVAVWLAGRTHAWAGIAVAGLLFTGSGCYIFLRYFSQRSVAPGSNPARLALLLPRMGKSADIVSYDMSAWNAFYYSSYQLLAPQRFVQFRGDLGETPRSTVVIAGKKWKDATRLGYRYVDGETMADNALFVSSPDLVKKAIGGKSLLGAEVGSAIVPGVLTEGVYGQECSGSGSDCMRWTDGHARISVNIGPDERAAKIAIELLAFEKTKARLLVDDAEKMTLDVGPGRASRTILLNPPASGRALSIGIDSATFIPGPQDPRKLGVQLRSIKVLP